MKNLTINRNNWTGLLILLLSYSQAYAFTTVDEQIDHYLGVLETGNYQQKIDVLKGLAWSGVTSPRLYDELEKQSLDQYLETNQNKRTINVLSHMIRALAFSGNEKYRNTLEEIKINGVNKNNRQHAEKALIQLNKFKFLVARIAASDFSIEGKPVEVAIYMKMLSVDNMYVQRLAAQGVFHDNLRDPDLLALTAEKLKVLYMQPGLDREALDTVAWLCKAIGQSGESAYKELLLEIAAKSPYKKIKKYAFKYAQ